MTSGKRNPAIYAGLAGAAAWACPVSASALTLAGHEFSVTGAAIPFVAGCAVGALVATGTTLAITRSQEARSQAAQAQRVLDEHARAMGPAWQTAPDADATSAVAADVTHSMPRAAGAHASSFANVPPVMPKQPVAGFAPNTFAADVDGTYASAAVENVDAKPASGENASGGFDVFQSAFEHIAAAHEAERANPAVAARIPRIDVEPSAKPVEPRGFVQDSDPNDYAAVAQAYVRKRTLADRMVSRAKGVARVLGERLEASHMDGLPVITRADGTVGDVGELWWDDALGDSQVTGVSQTTFAGTPGVNESLADNSAVLFTAQTVDEARAAYDTWRQASAPVATPAAQAPEAAAQASAAPSDPAQPTARAVPAFQTPEQASQPTWSPAIREEIHAVPQVELDQEERWSDKQQDLWAVALAALDERFDEQVAMGPEEGPVFSGSAFDEDGGDSLDEPEGLEPSTEFLSFRPQAGHPEVNNTDSYVNLLVDQEFNRSKSKAVRKSYRDYLRLIDGGTSELPRTAHMKDFATRMAKNDSTSRLINVDATSKLRRARHLAAVRA